MIAQPKIIGEPYDDVFISTNRASREVSIKSKFSRNITLNVPCPQLWIRYRISAMAIAMAQEGGIVFA
jgi:IMP dehydrogenase